MHNFQFFAICRVMLPYSAHAADVDSGCHSIALKRRLEKVGKHQIGCRIHCISSHVP